MTADARDLLGIRVDDMAAHLRDIISETETMRSAFEDLADSYLDVIAALAEVGTRQTATARTTSPTQRYAIRTARRA